MKKKKETIQVVEEKFDDVLIPEELKGLSTAAVQQKTAEGQVNQSEENLLKSDKEIIKENTINIFNLLNLVLAILVLLVGSPKNTLFFWCRYYQYIDWDHSRITSETYDR